MPRRQTPVDARGDTGKTAQRGDAHRDDGGARTANTAARAAEAGLAARLNALLPQTQCRQCRFDGCAPYAAAMAAGEAEINRCPPGGPETIAALARVLGRAPRPLDPTCGVHQPLAVALIDESRCIGCRLCIKACPVDAIVGAPRLMHTVLSADCTGCELCLPPCPVDCIEMVPRPAAVDDSALHARLDAVADRPAAAGSTGAPDAPDAAAGPATETSAPTSAGSDDPRPPLERRRATYWRWLHERRLARLASGTRADAARASRRAAHLPAPQASPGPQPPRAAGQRQAPVATHVPGRPGVPATEAERQAVIRAAVARARARRAAAGRPGGGSNDDPSRG